MRLLPRWWCRKTPEVVTAPSPVPKVARKRKEPIKAVETTEAIEPASQPPGPPPDRKRYGRDTGFYRCNTCSNVFAVAEMTPKTGKTNSTFYVCNGCIAASIRSAEMRSDPRYKWAAAAVRSSRARAKEAGVPHSIETEDVLEIAGYRCPVLGTGLIYNTELKRAPDQRPSLDRIIPSKGYVKGNIKVMSCRSNTMKNDALPHELAKFAKFHSEAP